VRDRYVLQVLLATLGSALLMALIAVVQTPADLWQSAPTPGASARSDATSPRGATFKDECEFPFHPGADCPPESAKPACKKPAGAAPKNCERGGAQAGAAGRC